MKNFILTLIIAILFSHNLQAQEQYNPDGTITIFDTDQPVKSVSQEDALLSSNKCIRWLFLADYYTLISIENDKDLVGLASTKYAEKTAIYNKLYKIYNCNRDDYERYKILKNNWYTGMQEIIYKRE